GDRPPAGAVRGAAEAEARRSGPGPRGQRLRGLLAGSPRRRAGGRLLSVDLGGGLVLPTAERVVRYPDRESWLAGRLNRLGGSDVGAILGLSPERYGGDWKTWAARRVGEAEHTPQVREWFRRGNREEPRILEDFAADSGMRVVGPLGLVIV